MNDFDKYYILPGVNGSISIDSHRNHFGAVYSQFSEKSKMNHNTPFGAV